MKTSLTKLSSSFVLLSLSLTAWGKPVAQVVEVSGTVFMVSPDGKTSALKLNQHLDDRAEVLVEEGASITLNDYYDATYHLTGGSHLKFFNKSVQLKKGKTWIQSMNSRHPLALTTANGHISYWKGEFITTFDQSSSRSQVLVVNGEVEVSNVLDQNMKHTVRAGTFTVVDPEVESGSPRTPTKVGLASLEKALAEFKELPSDLKVMPKREISSVEEEAPVVKKGEIIFITSNRMPASVQPEQAHKYYKKVVKKKIQASPVPIKIYGTSWSKTDPFFAPRKPASVRAVAPPVAQNPVHVLNNDPQFTDSLKEHSIQQPKYSKELESLIHDLKSY
jgi:hypothetical protein